METDSKNMELITTHICKASEIGIHGNMFGGTMMSMIDESAAAYASQLCDTPRMVTIKIEELVFKKPVKVGNLMKIYGNVIQFGRTSVSIYIEVRKHNVYTGEQDVVTHTNIKFVRIDEEGNPIPILDRIVARYGERLEKFGKGLLSLEEKDIK
jgi:acyl-CoA thioesterase YciA